MCSADVRWPPSTEDRFALATLGFVSRTFRWESLVVLVEAVLPGRPQLDSRAWTDAVGPSCCAIDLEHQVTLAVKGKLIKCLSWNGSQHVKFTW